LTDFRGWGVPIELGSRRVLHPGPLRWLRATGWMLLLFVALSFLAYGPILFLDHVLPEGEGPQRILSNGVGAVVALGLYVAAVWFGEARKPDEFALRPMLKELGIGLLTGLAMFSAVMAIMFAGGFYTIQYNGLQSAWTGLGLTIQSGVVEEVMFRAIMLRLLWRAFGPIPAFAISALFFGLVHYANPNSGLFPSICIAIEAGIMLGAFYALSGRVWVSVGVHAAWNFAQGWLFGAPVSGTDFGPHLNTSLPVAGAPDLMTGGAFGPEASVPGLIVGTLTGAVVLWMAWKAGRFEKRAD